MGPVGAATESPTKKASFQASASDGKPITLRRARFRSPPSGKMLIPAARWSTFPQPLERKPQ
jgi:hypothetical protein